MSNSDKDSKVAHVFPIDGSAGTGIDPWRLVAQGQAVMIEEAPGKKLSTGRCAPPASMLARGLLPLINEIDGGRGTLMRVQTPTGSTISDLAKASGGGHRGFTQSADTGRLSGHARLHPVNKGVRVTTAATAMVVAGAEIISNHEMHKKIDRLDARVSRLATDQHARQEAQLRQAEATIDTAYGIVSSRGLPPTSLGLDSAVDRLGTCLHLGDIWVEELVDGLTKIDRLVKDGKMDPDGIRLKDFAEAIRMPELAEDGPAEFERRARQYLRAISAENRLVVLTEAETQLRNPDISLPEFQSGMADRLSMNIARQEMLAEVMMGLTRERVTLPASNLFRSQRWSRLLEVHHVVNGLASSLSAPGPLPALLSGTGNQVLYVRSTEAGLEYALPRA